MTSSADGHYAAIHTPMVRVGNIKCVRDRNAVRIASLLQPLPARYESTIRNIMRCITVPSSECGLALGILASDGA